MRRGEVQTPPEERVPASAIAPIIQRWVEVYSATHEMENGNGLSARYVENMGNDGILGVLAFHCGVNARYLRSIKNGKLEIGNRRTGTSRFVDWVPFSIADKIVCGTVGPLAWHSEPLKAFYGPLPVARYERHLEEVAA